MDTSLVNVIYKFDIVQVKDNYPIDENAHEAQGSIYPFMAKAELGWGRSQK